MPSPLAHSATGYMLSQLFWKESVNQQLLVGLNQPFTWYAIGVAIAADFDFLPQLLSDASTHRGLTHSISFMILFSLCCSLIIRGIWKQSFRKVFIGTNLIYGSHLLLDFFTTGPRGMQLLWPFSDQFLRSNFFIFPPVHWSKGLFDPSHIIFVAAELVYIVLVLTICRLFNRKFLRNLISR